MTSMPPVPYKYNVQAQGFEPNQPLLYILQDGKLTASLFVLVLENGVWTEPSSGVFDTSVSQEPFGAGGTRIHFDGNLEGPQSGYELDLYLAFEVPVDFAEPLPLDRLSLDHCLLSLTTMFVTSSGPVLSVTRDLTPQSPVSAAAHPSLTKFLGPGAPTGST